MASILIIDDEAEHTRLHVKDSDLEERSVSFRWHPF